MGDIQNSNQNQERIELNEVLAEIHWELRKWLFGVTFIFAGMYALTFFHNRSFWADLLNSLPNEGNIFCGNFNPNVFGINQFVISFIIIIFLWSFIMLLDGKKRVSSAFEKYQMLGFMIISTFLLCIYIFLTGGFLDSPFSAALSIYLAGFLLIQDRKDTKYINYIVMVSTVFFILIPYFLYSNINIDDSTYFFDFSTDDTVANSRLVISFGLAIYSLICGQRISDKINLKNSP